MAQETVLEVDVFQKRIGSYLSWLSSMIELWERNPELLRRIEVTSKLLRDKYQTGTSLSEFDNDVKIVQELFEIVADAYPDEVEQVESKLGHFMNGVKEQKLGIVKHVVEVEKPRVVVKKVKKVKKTKIKPKVQAPKESQDSVAFRVGRWLRRFVYGDDNF